MHAFLSLWKYLVIEKHSFVQTPLKKYTLECILMYRSRKNRMVIKLPLRDLLYSFLKPHRECFHVSMSCLVL